MIVKSRKKNLSELESGLFDGEKRVIDLTFSFHTEHFQ